MTRLLTSFAVLAATGALVAGCGSDDDDSGSAAADTTATQAATTAAPASGASSSDLTLAAQEDGGLSFSKQTLTADAGKVRITMDNPQGNAMPHAIAVDGNGVAQDGEVVQAGGKSTVSLDLKPGKYTFYCPVGQHRQAGMEGTLTVQ